jgi:PKD repeat protein
MLFIVLGAAGGSFADVIIDNGGTGTSYTGTWSLSGATDPYGASSLWSRNGTTYTFSMSGQTAGTYEVFMWWSGYSTRASGVPVAINYTGGTANTTVNQQQNSGQWNSLGKYYFNGSGSVTITAATGDALSTCADAVKFTFVSGNTAPTAAIDSITPNPASRGESVTFTGHGTDTDGTIAAYEWTSSIDGTIGTAASFSASTLSAGTHTITFRVKDNEGTWSPGVTASLVVGTPSAEVIIDNGGTGTSYTGTWAVSGATGYYGASALWSRNGATYTFTMSGQTAGKYEVFMWWSAYSSRATSVPVAINYTGGTSNTTVNQLQNGGQWNSLGTFYFNGSGSVTITAADGDTLSTCADAVKFTLISSNTAPTATIDSITPSPAAEGQSVTFTGHGTDAEGTITAYEWTSSIDGTIGTAASFSTSTLNPGTHTITFRVKDNEGLWSTETTATLVVGEPSLEIVIDNTDSTTSSNGYWSASGATGYYGTNSIYSRDGATFTWQFTPTVSGIYDVSMWWTTTSTRAAAIPVVIDHADGSQTVTVNQLENAGQWNTLASSLVFLSGVTYNITITSRPYPASTCADAVKFTLKKTMPTAYIDSISPSPAKLGGAVTLTGHGDGTLTAYEWTSSIDGVIGSQATVTVSTLSAGAHTITFRVKGKNGVWSRPVMQDLNVVIIIDNTDATTSKTGTWSTSTATGYYGTNSVYSRDGATFTWSFTPPAAGYYDISMWWTTSSTRSSSIPVTINYAGGPKTVTVNQLENAGQWNGLGVYEFAAGVTYNITITAPASPTSTCADAVSFLKTGPTVPAGGFLADVLEGNAGMTVQFTDQSLGMVSSWLWNFGDGTTSTEQNPTHVYASAGYYTVSLTVSNSAGSYTKTMSQYIHTVPVEENIYLVDGYAKDAVFINNAKIILVNLGATQVGDAWVYSNAATGRTFTTRFVTTPSGFTAALKEQNAHVIFNGHSNFGLGASFAQGNEVYVQQMDDVYYIDDDRFTHTSTPMVSVKIDGVQYGQAYPNWLPVFKDGTSGIMPYTFAEGLPPYNYFLTYKLDGDPTAYKIELSDGSYLQRFPDSGFTPWYSADGLAPDPTLNPECFIVNNATDFNKCDLVGTWPIAKESDETKIEYMGYNYQYHAAGTGGNSATWTIVVKTPGFYKVSASWQSGSSNASNAVYRVQRYGGYTDVEVDQTVATPSGGYTLGSFYFDEGSYTIVLTDNANGRVVADSIMFTSLAGLTDMFQAEFGAGAITGSAPLAVQFTDYSQVSSSTGANISSWLWNFGDGTTSTERNPQHTYSSSGVYTVSLTITTTTGVQDTEIKTGLIAVGQTATLRAQFAAKNRIVTGWTPVEFIDQSSGSPTSWLWDFGDGATSTAQNPTHSFMKAGMYPVTLTVTSASGGTSAKTNSDYVQSFTIDAIIMADNVYHYKPHFSGFGGFYDKTILYGNTGVSTSDLKYARLFYGSCNSCNYYAGIYHRGILTCTTSDTDLYTALNYFQDYLSGMSDAEILTHLNTIQDTHEMLNFNLKPPSLR